MNLNNVPVEGEVPPRMRNRYSVRVKNASFGPSKSSGKPMITLNCEIVDPVVFEGANDKKYALDTIPFNYYLILEGKSLGAVRTFHERLKLPMDIDENNPDLSCYENLAFDTILDSREKREQRQNPTTGQWEDITDQDGRPIAGRWEVVANLRDVLCRTEIHSKPYSS